MSSPFSQTMESRRVDLFKIWLIVLAVAVSLIALWAYWFFAAPITFYETSREIRVAPYESRSQQLVQNGGTYIMREKRMRLVIAKFAPDALQKIQPQQRALVYLDGDHGKPRAVVRAEVTKVVRPAEAHNEQQAGEVHLHAESSVDAPSPFREGQSGVVEIEVDHTSPAAIMFAASGKRRQSRPVSNGPVDRTP